MNTDQVELEFRAARALLNFLQMPAATLEKVPCQSTPTPDFSVSTADGRLAIEVVGLTENDVARRDKFKLACQDKLWPCCHESTIPIKVEFWVWSNDSALRKASAFATAAIALRGQLMNSQAGPWLEHDVDQVGRVRVTRLQPGCESIVLAPNEQFAGNRVEVAWSRIAKKEAKLPAYRSMFPTVWLLLVTGSDFGQLAVGEWLARELFPHSFDRGFIYDGGAESVVELRRLG